jgi:hypothetical protein
MVAGGYRSRSMTATERRTLQRIRDVRWLAAALSLKGAMAHRVEPSLETGFALREPLAAKVARLGRSGEPVIVIDGLMRDPDALIDRAAAAAFLPAHGNRGGYPGLRAPAPRDYAERLVRAVDPLIRDTFAAGDIAPARVDVSFSIVTTPPGSLHLRQRVPHIDTTNRLRFALLHFLCGPPFGGTAFFRHRTTGLEQIAAEDFAAFAEARRRDLAELPPPSGYPNPRTPGFEQTACFAARLDRLLVYRSFSLHSGVIPPSVPLSPEPRSGRLTANIFVDYERRA